MSGHGVCDCAVKRGYWATFDRGHRLDFHRSARIIALTLHLVIVLDIVAGERTGVPAEGLRLRNDSSTREKP